MEGIAIDSSAPLLAENAKCFLEFCHKLFRRDLVAGRKGSCRLRIYLRFYFVSAWAGQPHKHLTAERIVSTRAPRSFPILLLRATMCLNMAAGYDTASPNNSTTWTPPQGPALDGTMLLMQQPGHHPSCATLALPVSPP